MSSNLQESTEGLFERGRGAERDPQQGVMDAAFKQMLSPLMGALSDIQLQLKSVASGESHEAKKRLEKFVDDVHGLVLSSREDKASVADAVRDTVGSQIQGVIDLLSTFTTSVDQRLAGIQELLVDEGSETDSDESSLAWEEAILGPELSREPRLEAGRQQLIEDLRAGNSDVKILLGHVMMASSLPPQRLLPLLKDLGEAFYAWSSRADSQNRPMETALTEWLVRRCANLTSIETVSPGDAFDIRRHVATDRGARVCEVLGWVVLRDDGNVYSKAKVTVR